MTQSAHKSECPGGGLTVTSFQHGLRIALLMATTALLLTWGLRHTEASFADGLRYIRHAQQIDQGAWRDGLLGSIDHPLHPLGIVAAHAVIGGDGPVSWQRAAVALAFGSLVLLVIPLYLLARDTFGDESAWLGTLLVVANPLISSIAVNVLSESTFLFFWTWGLWAAVRFLREGRFSWLPLAILFGILAYLSRPEGMLLPLAMVATLALLPLHRAMRINWPRWWRACAFLILGSLSLAGPFMAMKGGPGTKPAIARVLGLAPASPPDALERERPLPADQTVQATYLLASGRMLRVIRSAVTTPLLPLAILGLWMIPAVPSRARVWLFFGVILLASAVGLVRLHATGGYCTVRHGLVPAMILILGAGRGLTWLMGKISVPGKWFGLAQERLRPGPVVWLGVIALLLVPLHTGAQGHSRSTPFDVYYETGAWLARNTNNRDQVLDLTDWSLFFSERPGYRFAHVYDALADSQVRWIVLRKPHLEGHWQYSKAVRELVADREPVALVPLDPRHGELQLQIYDRLSPVDQLSRAGATIDPSARR
jgi:4-amino-4-deoxy-L-arabinose transferase-like glycosyltransferase